MKNFFKRIGAWCSQHIWQSIVIGVAVVGVVATSITLPIVLGDNKGPTPEPEPEPEPAPEPTGVDGTILCGNIVTMDETNPTVEAVGIKDGKIVAIGTKDEVSNVVKGDVITKTYSNDDYIYPGFVDTHSHYAVLSNILSGGTVIDAKKDDPDGYEAGDYEAYAKQIKTFVDANPDKEVYQAYGFLVSDNLKYPKGQTPTAKMLDDVIPTDKPIIVIGEGGHDCWLNTAAIKKYIGNFEGTEEEKQEVKKWIEEVGKDCVYVTVNRPYSYIPTGYFCETARFRITDNVPYTVEEIKESILALQEDTLCKGYTTVGDCSIIESDINKQVTAFKELCVENKLKIKFRSYYEIREYDSKETRDAQLQYAIELAEETKNNDYFQVVGIKVFLDGVYEALSAYTLDTYSPEAGKADGYKGIQRWYGSLDNDLKELVYKANEAGLAMEFHAMGDGAVNQALNACQYANEKLVSDGKTAFNKNAISHIGLVSEADKQRFADLNVTAVVGAQWGPVLDSYYPIELRALGQERAEKLYPVKSIMDKGVNVAFHTDGAFYTAPEMIYDATTRVTAIDSERGDHIRSEEEKIDALSALKCLTVNAAYALNSDSTIGMIKVGAAADFTVYNKDYTKDEVARSLEEYKTAELIALYSNGVNLL